MGGKEALFSDRFPHFLLRALHLRKPGGPPHVKLAVEWDSSVMER